MSLLKLVNSEMSPCRAESRDAELRDSWDRTSAMCLRCHTTDRSLQTPELD